MDFVQQIFELLIFPSLAVLCSFGVWYLKYRVEAIKQQLENDEYNKYIDMATNAICSSVIMLNQTYVQSLKEQGAFDKEAQARAFSAACNNAMTLMGAEAVTFLREAMDDFDLWLKTQVEATVNLNK